MKKCMKMLLAVFGSTFLFSVNVFAGWNQNENGQWSYDQDGTVLAGQWLEEQGSWYYLGTDGIMYADTTQMIDGVEYSFDALGRWIEPQQQQPEQQQIQTGISDGFYYNAEFGYSIELPAAGAYLVDEDLYIDAGLDYVMTSQHFKTDADTDIGRTARLYADTLINGMSTYVSYTNESDVSLGGMPFRKIHCSSSTNLAFFDVYIYSDETGFWVIATSYTTDTEHILQARLNTIRTLY